LSSGPVNSLVQAMSSTAPLAAIFGCAGPVLQADEAAFFRDCDPLGFILFARNCQTPEQIRRLTGDLRNAVGRTDAPVLMDQEGGRVQRLPSPPWRKVPAPGLLGQLPPEKAAMAVALNAQLMAMELKELGVDVNCVPSLDVNDAAGHQVIGDRALSADPGVVAQLGRALADGLARGGVLPVMKHMPGHGRATVDSHLELPIVTADRRELTARDFLPFMSLADLPLGMSAHVLYTELDPDNPATLSKRIIDEVIRGQIGFQGLLFTDDLSMQALGGEIGQRAAAALAAGCDVALHCNGERADMQSVAAACHGLTAAGQGRWQSALDWRRPLESASREDITAKLAALL
jgi:beta-N-acetylhexosaminidase